MSGSAVLLPCHQIAQRYAIAYYPIWLVKASYNKIILWNWNGRHALDNYNPLIWSFYVAPGNKIFHKLSSHDMKSRSCLSYNFHIVCNDWFQNSFKLHFVEMMGSYMSWKLSLSDSEF